MVTDPLFGKAKWHDTELEKDFQKRVVELFVLHGWRVYSVPDSRRVTAKGWPDLTMWKGDKFIWAELKREKGRLSEDQKLMHAELEKFHPVFVWRPSNWDWIVLVARGADEAK